MPAAQGHRARVIAIDGPAASGKSVVGAGVASALGYRFFDTGAMYRALTWLVLDRGIDPEDVAAVAALAEATRITVNEGPPGDPDPTHVMLDGVDATPHLRDRDVESNVSLVSRIPRLRTVLVEIQRELAKPGGVVMAGRDIGTVVLPRADLKVYLDASPAVRADRRAAQAADSGFDADAAALRRRDVLDSTRQGSPLIAADDAVIIQTDDMPIEDVIARILELAR